jgi:hypothetical protein
MTTNGTHEVQYYGNILEALQRAIPGSVHIAGGAPRDSILGRPIRDVDIFLPDAAGDEAATLLRSKFGYVKVGEWKKYEHFSDPSVMRVAKLEKADETIPICLIGLAEDLDWKANTARFDFGACAVAWCGDDFMLRTERFNRDIESETFTLYRADNYAQFAYSMIRFEKLTADRYKGWELSVPDEFAELVKEHTFRRNWYFAEGAHFGLENSSQILRPKDR